MAEERTLVDHVTPSVTVASKADATNWQYFAVQVHAAGVTLADIRSAAYGPTFILAHDVDSGQYASLVGPPSISKARAGAAITQGVYVEVQSATGLLITAASAWLGPFIGMAWTSAAGSGEIFSVKLGR